jgi:SWI/SNF-related matrix-associated actin-dependent regulator of chromatin subfamily A3
MQVFLLSVRSGAVGINLTSTNYVFMMEPLMNPALDDQAVGRAWRMGQKRRVTVKRLFMKGTLEESIMKIAEARRVRARALGTARDACGWFHVFLVVTCGD